MADGIVPLAASEIKPKAFRTTLFWPLALDLSKRDDRPMANLIQEQFDLIDAPWEREYDPLAHLNRPPDAGADEGGYAEFAYFHDFVQLFLFRKQPKEEPAPPFFLFRRDDIRQAQVLLTAPDGQPDYRRFTLSVERLRLYVFSTGVALIVVEFADVCGKVDLTDETGAQVRASRAVTLADVQDLNDRLRRAYAPYVDPGTPDKLPCLTPVSVVWVKRSDDFSTPPARKNNRALAQGVERLWKVEPPAPRFVPLFDYWRVLSPQKWHIDPRGADSASWRHVVGECMPLLSWISLTNHDANCGGEDHYYRGVSEGDWSRLCYVDGAGGDSWPYASAFLRKLDAQGYYDRFHIQRGDGTHAPWRLLMSGYAMTAVGCGDNFDELIATYMRRQCFQMMLLAQFELATLLGLSGRITRAVEEHHTRDDVDQLEERLQNIEQDFLQFVHRFRFTGVSNQLQARELFEKLRAQMQLQAIYTDVKEELTTATNFLAMRSSARQARSATRLSVVATLGVVFGLAFAFLGMNVLVTPDLLSEAGVPKASGLGRHVAVLFGTIGVASGLSLALLTFLPGSQHGGDPIQKWLKQITAVLALISIAIAIAAAIAAR